MRFDNVIECAGTSAADVKGIPGKMSKIVRRKLPVEPIKILSKKKKRKKKKLEEMSFSNPFPGNIPRPINKKELIRALRMNVAAEEDAAATYEAQAEATDNKLAKKVLIAIANEERIHIGEFKKLINILTKGEEALFFKKGKQEVSDMEKELKWSLKKL